MKRYQIQCKCHVKMNFTFILIHLLVFSVIVARCHPGKKKKYKNNKGVLEAKQAHTNYNQDSCPSGESQSPIDLVHPWRTAPNTLEDAIALPGHYAYTNRGRDYEHKLLRGNAWFGRSREKFYVYNDNGQVTFEFLAGNGGKPTSEMTIRGEGWDDEYVVAFGRITWGAGNRRGSEHTIDGRHFSMELQLITYRKSDDSYDNALKKKGIRILGLLLELSGVDNPHLEPLIKGAAIPSGRSSVFREDTRIHGPINLHKLLTNDHNAAMNYFEYEGSTTFPPCEGGVKWIVFDQPSTVSERQIRILRNWTTDSENKPMSDNFRPLQALGDRTVKFYGSVLKIVREEIPLDHSSNFYAPGSVIAFMLLIAHLVI